MSAKNGHAPAISLWTFYFCIFFITNNLAVGLDFENWGVTRINVKKYTYLWTINNYSELNKLNFGEFLTSPIFPGDNSNDYQWQLKLYPKGSHENQKHWVGLSVYLTNKSNVTAGVQLHIIDGTGNKTNSRSHPSYLFKPINTGYGSGWGTRSLILQSELQGKAENLLPNDSLKVLAEITVKEEITNTSGKCRFSSNIATTEHMGILLENSFLSDVELLVDGQLLKAHRTILATHSSWFLKEFTKNPNLDALYIENTTIAAAKQALRFMYTGRVEIAEDNAVELLSLSDQLGIPQLKLISEEVLCKSMNTNNAIDILKVAELHDAENLSREVVSYIVAHADSIADSPELEELEKSYPNPFYRIFRRIIHERKC